MAHAIRFTANSVVVETPTSVSLANESGDWLGLSYEPTEDVYDDDPTARIYSEFHDQGHGGWGGIARCQLTPSQFVLRLTGERDAELTIDLQLGADQHRALASTLQAIFVEAPKALQLT